MDEHITVENQVNHCFLTFNRPEKLNILSNRMLIKLNEVLDNLKNDQNVRLVVFRGAGDRAFTAGFEIEDQGFDITTIEQRIGPFTYFLTRLQNYPKPIISLVNGYAIGGGCMICAASDIVIATKDSKFSLPELGLGMGILLKPVIESVGKRNAFELALTRKKIGAEEAKGIGLVNYVADHLDNAYKYLEEMIDLLCGNAPHALSVVLPALREAVSSPYDSSLQYLHSLNTSLMLGHEIREGIQSIHEKKTPSWNVKKENAHEK